MKALILNSGIGKRMGVLTESTPKCMTKISENETIISRQLKELENCKITDVVITTGFLDNILIDYCNTLNLNLNYTFIKNDIYDKTNYIYSIYLAEKYIDDDILLMHGDLVFDLTVLEDIINEKNSCMAVSSKISLPDKDFKAVIKDGIIDKIGINFFDGALTAQPLYKINKRDWKIWMESIIDYCKMGKVNVYAEEAFNEISHKFRLYPLDFEKRLCTEVDTIEDLDKLQKKIKYYKKNERSEIL